MARGFAGLKPGFSTATNSKLIHYQWRLREGMLMLTHARSTCLVPMLDFAGNWRSARRSCHGNAGTITEQCRRGSSGAFRIGAGDLERALVSRSAGLRALGHRV